MCLFYSGRDKHSVSEFFGRPKWSAWLPPVQPSTSDWLNQLKAAVVFVEEAAEGPRVQPAGHSDPTCQTHGADWRPQTTETKCMDPHTLSILSPMCSYNYGHFSHLYLYRLPVLSWNATVSTYQCLKGWWITTSPTPSWWDRVACTVTLCGLFSYHYGEQMKEAGSGLLSAKKVTGFKLAGLGCKMLLSWLPLLGWQAQSPLVYVHLLLLVVILRRKGDEVRYTNY